MKLTTQNNGDSEWSIEIYEGICLPNVNDKLPTESKQRCAKGNRNSLQDTTRPLHPFFQPYSTQLVAPAQSSVPLRTDKASLTVQEEGQAHTARGTRENLAVRSSECWDPKVNNKNNRRPDPPPSRVFKLAAGANPKTSKIVATSIGLTKPQSRIDRDPGITGTPYAFGVSKQKQARRSNAAKPVSSTSARDSSSSRLLNKTKGSTTPVYNYMEYREPPVAVVYTQCEDEADTLVQSLDGPLGFDLEWRVMWQAGAPERRTALVQLCDTRTVLLIQVSSMKRFPKKVLEVLESPNVVKTGANIRNDGEKLYRDFGIRARGLVELGALATKADGKFSSIYNRQVVSLAKMASLYLGKTLVKDSVRTSNWEAPLTHKMVQYAANDCHCALMVFNAILEIADKDDTKIFILSCSCEINPQTTKLGESGGYTAPSGKTRSNGLPVVGPLSPQDYCIPEPISPQYLRAYKMWYERKTPLDRMCMELKTGGRMEPLKASTVISYVVSALQANALLPFDLQELKELLQMDAGSWQRHRQWMQERERCLSII